MAKTEKSQRWVFYADIDGSSVGEGVTRKILAYDEEGMCVEHSFEKGAVGSLHSHPQTQITYVADGVFEFEIDGEKKTVKKGDTMLKQNSIVHGCVCLEKGALIDFFTPMRKDFV
ncbi:MAG: cupin domain-containing protein [Oscillospiraceae bacterium]|nr:cupin domain-containing protein [Oscillospiraceae bacterium]